MILTFRQKKYDVQNPIWKSLLIHLGFDKKFKNAGKTEKVRLRQTPRLSNDRFVQINKKG